MGTKFKPPQLVTGARVIFSKGRELIALSPSGSYSGEDLDFRNVRFFKGKTDEDLIGSVATFMDPRNPDIIFKIVKIRKLRCEMYNGIFRASWNVGKREKTRSR